MAQRDPGGRRVAGKPRVTVRRVYEPADPAGGARVLVDRVWPRGLRRDSASLDEWCKQVAPSPELRRWYGHDPDRFDEFAARYRAELDEPERAEALARLRQLAKDRPLALLTATRDITISHAAVLAGLLHQ